MRQVLLLALFIGLMIDSMFGWGIQFAPGVSLKNGLLYLLFIVLAIEFATSSRRTIIDFGPIHLFFIILCAIATLSWAASVLLESPTRASAVQGFVSLKGRMLDHYLFFLVFFMGLRSSDEVARVRRWVLLAIAAGNLAAVMDAYNLPDLAFIETKDGRVTGPLGEANQYGLFSALFLPILAAQALVEKGAWRGIFVLGTAATFWVLLLTASRGAFISLFVGMAACLIILWRYVTAQQLARLASLGVFALIAAALLLGDEYRELIEQRVTLGQAEGNVYDMTSGRTWIWAQMIGVLLSSPTMFFTGHGWNTARDLVGFAPHSAYVGHLYEIGVPGLLAFISILADVFLAGLRGVHASARNPLRMPPLVGFLMGFIVLCVGIAAVDFFDPWYFVWAYVGLAMRDTAVVLQARNSIGPSASETRAGTIFP